jgi:tripartite-type tricarboxylate transporter receptor subunit TctC
MLRRNALSIIALATSGASVMPVRAAAYPAKTITLVAPFAAGSSPDALVRALAQAMSTDMAQNVIVENKPGASSILAAQAVARATPDGYTLLISGNVAFTANPFMFRRLAYDPVVDFSPITALARGPMILYANPRTVPVRNVAEFVKFAKRQPRGLNFGYTSATSRMPAELLQQVSGIPLNGVAYKAGYQALPDLLEGRIDLLFTDLGAMTYVKSGQLNALAVADTERSPFTPDVPTLQEAGIAGVDLPYWVAAYAPARTPPAVVQRLHAVLARACQTDAVRKAMAIGGTVPFVTTPDELQRFQAKDMQRWERVIRTAGIQAE